jgi:5'(3')-deoxyribonucleotidase
MFETTIGELARLYAIDNLEKMFAIQKRFAKKVDAGRDDIEAITKDYAIHMAREAFEVLDAVNWKVHRSRDVETNKYNLVEEVVDITKLAIGLSLAWGVTPKEFMEIFEQKSEVVEQRYLQEHLAPPTNPVGVDIDGVLAKNDEKFLEFAHAELRRRHALPTFLEESPLRLQVTNDLEDQKIRTRVDFRNTKELKAYLGPEYETLKAAYRDSGLKREVEAYPGAAEFIEELQKMGYSIVLLSARPYRRHLRIFSDTMHWLRANFIDYDAIFFDEFKHLKIVKKIPTLQFMIEDDPKIAQEVCDLGYFVYLKAGSDPTPSCENVAIWESYDDLLRSIKAGRHQARSPRPER